MLLRECSELAQKRIITDKDHKPFKTVGFDPDELLQLKVMTTKELQGLMIFCGVEVLNGVPFVVMDDEEMRTAYLAWRYSKIQERKNELRPFAERGIKWLKRLNQMMRAVERQ